MHIHITAEKINTKTKSRPNIFLEEKVSHSSIEIQM